MRKLSHALFGSALLGLQACGECDNILLLESELFGVDVVTGNNGNPTDIVGWDEESIPVHLGFVDEAYVERSEAREKLQIVLGAWRDMTGEMGSEIPTFHLAEGNDFADAIDGTSMPAGTVLVSFLAS